MNSIVHAALDPQDRLLSDDPRLADLHCRLGGAPGAPLSLPPIIALGRTARRLGRMVTRPIALAAPNADIALWVRAQPDHETVLLTLFDWTEEPVPMRAGGAGEPEIDTSQSESRRDTTIRGGKSAWFGAPPAGGWSWRVDADFRLLDVAGPEPLPAHGSALTRWLVLDVEDDGTMPLLAGVAARAPFSGQRARLRGGDERLLMLAGEPVLSDRGFAGYGGTLSPLLAEEPAVEPPAAPASYSLDNALRRPLSRIIANADTISGQFEGPLRRDYAAYAEDIAVAGRHLMALVDDLADLRAIERPAFTVAHEMVDLADVARRAGGLLGVKAADRKIRLHLPAKEDSYPAAAEFRRVLQILVNLIGNAVRYSPEGSEVWVRGALAGARATLTVADQGRGIPPEDQERVFAKFERLGRRDAAGSGLGLYISRRLARAMGGDLRLESTPGDGARFTLDLPAWPSP